MALLMQSLEIPDIAFQLGATADVVRKRLSEIYKKLGVEGPPGPGGKLKALRQRLNQAQAEHQSQPLTSVSQLHGRDEDVESLQRWIAQDECRLLVILGERGMGKTALAGSLFQTLQLQHQFDRYYWIAACPPIAQLLAQLLQSPPELNIHADASGQISRILDYLREYRCLVVLDQVDTLFETKQVVGHYRQGYASYSDLFKRLGEEQHRSCFILTSLVKLPEIEALQDRDQSSRSVPTQSETVAVPVRTWELKSLPEAAALKIIEKYIKISNHDAKAWSALIQQYRGNPLSLKLATSYIDEYLGGDVTAFLNQETLVFGDIYTLIEQQIQHLSAPELDIIKILSVHPSGLSLLDLIQSSHLTKQKVMTAIQSLRRRSLLTRGVDHRRVIFALPPLIAEHEQHKLEQESAGS